MRNFNFQDAGAATQADSIAVRPAVIELPETTLLDQEIRRDEIRADAGLRPLRVEHDEEDQSNSTAKIVGGIVVGLLIVGGGLYAYESSSKTTPVQQVALKSPVANHMATDQAANPPAATSPETAPNSNAAPSQTTPDGISPTPSHSRTPSRVQRADNADANTPAASVSTADASVNAPMTLTPDTAPAAEQSAPAGQTAMQQPVTAPVVSGQAAQAQPEVANNDAAAAPVAPAVIQPQLQAPIDQSAQQPAPTPAQ